HDALPIFIAQPVIVDYPRRPPQRLTILERCGDVAVKVRPVHRPSFNLAPLRPETKNLPGRLRIATVDGAAVEAELEVTTAAHVTLQPVVALVLDAKPLVLAHQRGDVPHRITNRQQEPCVREQPE